MRRHPNVINVDEVVPSAVARGAHRFTRASLGGAAGGRQLGGSVYVLEPGARSYPLHWHGANEEAIYVLAGTGLARLGDARVPIRAGDWIALPTGPAHAHQLINDGAAPLVYLCVGTEHTVEVIGYPDSGKLNVLGGDSWDALWVSTIAKRGPDADVDEG